MRRFQLSLQQGPSNSDIPYQVSLVRPNEEWHLHNAWFVKQLNFHTRFKARRPTSEVVGIPKIYSAHQDSSICGDHVPTIDI